MKIYAIMMTYEQMDWLPWSIDQFDRALEFGAIDGVHISEGGHSKKVPARSTDGSWEYLQERIGDDHRYKIFDAKPFRDAARVYGEAQAPLIDKMCEDIPRGSWIWGIHDDEFFFDEFLKNIRNIAEKAQLEGYDMVMTKQMGFAFNFKLYWNKRTAYMLFNWKDGIYWKPITTPCYPGGKPLLKQTDKIKFDTSFDHITFHFSHVKRPKRLQYRASDLPTEIGAPQASVWYKEVYKKADLNNLELVYERNKTIQGGYGFYKDSPDMGPEIYQTLNVYEGLYPEVLEGHPYMNIDDIRKIK